MKLKKGIAWLPPALAALSIAAVLAAGYVKLSRYKTQVASQTLRISAQDKQLAELQAELAALKAKGPTIITETLRDLEPPPPPPQTPVEEVFAPEVAEPSFSSKIDDLKKRYEELLVSYFVLRKCAMVNATDYHVLMSALAQEMASLNAPGRLQYDILTSAQGSYQELYSGSTCEKEKIETLYTPYRAYIDSITERFTPR